MTTTDIVALLVVGALAVITAAQVVEHRRGRRRHDAPSAADTILGTTASSFKAPTALLASVILATVFGAVAAGVGIGNQVDQPGRDRDAQATNNYQRCTAVVGGQFRKAIDVFLIGYSVTDHAELAQVTHELHLPDDADSVKSIARARVVASYIDDLRLDSNTLRLCPFVPGRPDLTPERPIAAATDALDARLAQAAKDNGGTPPTIAPPPQSTTTTTTPGAHP